MDLIVKHELYSNGFIFHIFDGNDVVANLEKFDLGFLDDVENWETTFRIFATGEWSPSEVETRLRQEEKLKNQFQIIGKEGWKRKETEGCILYTLVE